MSLYREPPSKCPGCSLGHPPGTTECTSCGTVWGDENLCPHCEKPAKAVRGGAFVWSCSACSGVRLPARVARVLGPDPDGSLRHLFRDYTSWSRTARRKQRALVAIAVIGPLAVALVWGGLLLGGEGSFGTLHTGISFVVGMAIAVGATLVYMTVRNDRDRAEVVAIDDRGEIRRTYRRAAAMLLREEELTDDELAELVQSTRDIRRTRVAAGVHAAPQAELRVAVEEAPVSQAPRSSDEAALGEEPSEEGGAS